ncbi:MAG TPA: clostripain-related cysteine peptidase [Pyrinomonadaceae bacterium]
MKERQWTVMVYMAGDKHLDNNGFADLKEMKEAGSTAEVALIAQFSRGVKHRPTKRYYLRKDGRDGALAGDVVEDLGETDTADPRSLEAFVRWGVENYPARRYMLVMWGHGNGADDENVPNAASHPHRPDADEGCGQPTRGIGISHAAVLDSDTVDFLDTRKFKQALDAAREIIGREVDVLGMDACLMSGAEVCYQVRGGARFTVAPEGVAPLDGWPYNRILGELVARPEMEPERLACLVAEKYLASYADYEDVSVTQAVCDLGKCDALARSVDALAGALLERLPEAGMIKSIVLSRWQAQSFDGTEYVDLYDFCSLLRENSDHAEVRSACEEVMKTVGPDEFVVKSVYKEAALQYCYGLSIYFPQKEVSRTYQNLDFVKDTRWGAFLDAFVSTTRRPDRAGPQGQGR